MSNVYRRKYDQRPIWATGYCFNSLLIREGEVIQVKTKPEVSVSEEEK